MNLEEQETLEIISPALKNSLKLKRHLKTEEKVSDKLESLNQSLFNAIDDKFFSSFSPQVKTHTLHPENPFNIDLTKPLTTQASDPNLIFRSDYRMETSSQDTYEEVTSQLEPVPLVMDSCYSHKDFDENNSISSPHGKQLVHSAESFGLSESDFAFTLFEADPPQHDYETYQNCRLIIT